MIKVGVRSLVWIFNLLLFNITQSRWSHPKTLPPTHSSSVKIYFVTFSNLGFMLPFRIRRESKNSGFFNTVVVHNEKTLNLNNRSIQFARTYRKGFGLYFWKPKILLRALNEIAENDIVIYADAGTKINKQGEDRFRDYIEILHHDPNLDGILFSANHTNFPDTYSRASYIPQIDTAGCFYSPTYSDFGSVVYASPIIVRKTIKSVEMVKFWEALCDDFHLLSTTVDFDNGLLNFALGCYGQ